MHFGAVDYRAVVYINGQKATEHAGGYTPFSVNITEYLKPDGNYIMVCAYDNIRSYNQPAGKQSDKYESHGCFYSRTTGIWQTVWMEFVDKSHVDNIKITTDISAPSATIGIKVSKTAIGKTVRIQASWNEKLVGEKEIKIASSFTETTLELSEKHLWKIGEGGLYDLNIILTDGNKIYDSVKSYFGLRNVFT